jgi:hypothetical protein
MEALSLVPDPRSRLGRRHALPAVLALSSIAVMCGCRSVYPALQWDRDQGEIQAAPALLEGLVLLGQVVTGDALLAQQDLGLKILRGRRRLSPDGQRESARPASGTGGFIPLATRTPFRHSAVDPHGARVAQRTIQTSRE